MKLKLPFQIVKELAIFWLVASVVTVLSLWWLVQKRQSSFHPAVYEQMLTGESGIKLKTSSPCQYSLIGDPNTTNFVKIEITCADGTKSHNTLSLEAIKNRTVRGVLAEFARINGLTFTADKHWSCILKQIPVTDWDTEVTAPADIVCNYAP